MRLEAIFNQARCFDTAQKSSESYIVTDGKTIEVSPVSAIESCEMRLGKVEPFCSKKPSDARVIRQQMKKCKRCGANQLHKKFQCPAQKVSALNTVAMDILRDNIVPSLKGLTVQLFLMIMM